MIIIIKLELELKMVYCIMYNADKMEFEDKIVSSTQFQKV